MMIKQVATPGIEKARIDAVLNSIADGMCNLYDRYVTEFEDFAEYEKTLKGLFVERAPAHFKFVKVSKKPFAIHFEINGQIGYQIFANSSNCGWKRAVK